MLFLPYYAFTSASVFSIVLIIDPTVFFSVSFDVSTDTDCWVFERKSLVTEYKCFFSASLG